MKKIVLLVAFAFIGTSVTFAQDKAIVKTETKTETKTTKKKHRKPHTVKTTITTITEAKVALPKVDGAGMVFDNETIDYGTVAHNADGKREFVFVNNGNKPLIITNTQGSCGCTVPTTPKEPIAPGGKGIIGVKYATDRVGAFTKTVTVTSNAEGQPTKTLTIKGTVLADEVAAPKS